MGVCLPATPAKSPVTEWHFVQPPAPLKNAFPSSAFPVSSFSTGYTFGTPDDRAASAARACRNVAMSRTCASFSGIAGMPLSGRPCRITCPIWSPFTWCATSGERIRAGPRAPVASAPWQNPQDCTNSLRPRSAAAAASASVCCLAADLCAPLRRSTTIPAIPTSIIRRLAAVPHPNIVAPFAEPAFYPNPWPECSVSVLACYSNACYTQQTTLRGSAMNWKILVPAAVLLAVALLIFFWPHPQDCSFSGWKRSVGVDLDVAVGDVHAIKGKVGISDDQVRHFDTLMKDFALKYDAACQDLRNHRMNQADYTCRRKNMDDTLNKIRFFVEKVEAAKTLSDPAAQREIVLGALSSLEQATKPGLAGDCTSAMSVAPVKLRFEDHASEHSIQVSNAGNSAMNFSVVAVPIEKMPQHESG